MPLAKCIRRCWDSQATKRYWEGDVTDMPENHPLIKAKCFVILTAEEVAKGKEQTQTQLTKAFEMIAELTKKIETLEGEKGQPEEKRSPGRPKLN